LKKNPGFLLQHMLSKALKQEIINHLSPLNPRKIILFGSYVHGIPSRESCGVFLLEKKVTDLFLATELHRFSLNHFLCCSVPSVAIKKPFGVKLGASFN